MPDEHEPDDELLNDAAAASWYLTGAMHVFVRQFLGVLSTERSTDPQTCHDWAELALLVRRSEYPLRRLLEAIAETKQRLRSPGLADQFVRRNLTRFVVYDREVDTLCKAFNPTGNQETAIDVCEMLVAMLVVWRNRINCDARIDHPNHEGAPWPVKSCSQPNRLGDIRRVAYRPVSGTRRLKNSERDLDAAIQWLNECISSEVASEICRASRLLFLKVYLYAASAPDIWTNARHERCVATHERAVQSLHGNRRQEVVAGRLRVLQSLRPSQFCRAAIDPSSAPVPEL